MASVSYKNVMKSYGDNVVIKDLNIEIADKEFVVFVGPSGCGKSTSLRMLAGLEEITAGEIWIGDRVVNDVPPKDRDIAMVFQSYALYPHMTVYDNMAFGLKLRKTPKAEIDRRVKEAAQILGLDDLLDRRPKALSGGQRQRVAVGRAIVREPAVFLMDEPLSNLDAKLRVSARAEISKLHQRLQTTFVYVTHDQVEAMTMGDRIAVLNFGDLMQIDSPRNLYESPNNMFVAGFIGSPRMNLIDAIVAAANGGFELVAGEQRVSIPPLGGISANDSVTFGARPEHIEIVDEADADISAVVDLSEQLGGETYLYCTPEGMQQLTVHQLGQLPIERGQRIFLRFDRSSMHLFDGAGQVIANGVS